MCDISGQQFDPQGDSDFIQAGLKTLMKGAMKFSTTLDSIHRLPLVKLKKEVWPIELLRP